eukprot:281011-Rhodomonas_salina.2
MIRVHKRDLRHLISRARGGLREREKRGQDSTPFSPTGELTVFAMRKREKGSEEPSSDEPRRHPEPSSRTEVRRLRWLSLLGLSAVLCFTSYLLIFQRQRRGPLHRLPRRGIETDEEIFNRTMRELREYVERARLEPTFGISRGAYDRMHASTHERLRQCRYRALNNATPPLSLLEPGRLSARTDLPEQAQCFLWYMSTFWSRATGMFFRVLQYICSAMFGTDLGSAATRRWSWDQVISSRYVAVCLARGCTVCDATD